MEVKYIWTSKFRTSTVLYIWCRYALAANIIYLLTIAKKLNIRVCISPFFCVPERDWIILCSVSSQFPLLSTSRSILKCSQPSCEGGYIISSSLSLLGRAAVIREYQLPHLCIISSHVTSVVWTARTYAVFGRNRFILIFFGAIGLTCIILDVVSHPFLVVALPIDFEFFYSGTFLTSDAPGKCRFLCTWFKFKLSRLPSPQLIVHDSVFHRGEVSVAYRLYSVTY
jgi:hypothetical protein